jgi:DNA adenine methylase
MTAYHGGKQRIGRELAEIIVEESLDIEDEYNFKIKGYCEPFSGMMGVYRHIPELFQDTHPKIKYVAGEINGSVVKMWNTAKRGWKPPTKNIGKNKFYMLKHDNKTSALKGFVGHVNTFRGHYFNTYFKHGNNKIKTNSERVQSIGKTLNKNKVSVKQGDYKQFSNIKGYVIYCDPPYVNTVCKYNVTFDNKEFWSWCRKMSRNNILFISEYSAPKDFEKIWSKKSKMTGNIHKSASGNTRTENLFLL